jgi:proteasome lid subunit RPN8/RPN11
MAWAKLLYLRDVGGTEIGGFGIVAESDPLLVEDVRLVRQRCSPVTVAFDDAAVADYFDEQVDAGLPPERFSRIWLHTHPGDSPLPSFVDEATFARVFGSFHWAVMGIVARNDATYARLQYRVGPHGAYEIPVAVDYSQPFGAADHQRWLAEYDLCVDAALDRFIDDLDFEDRIPRDWPFDPEEWEDLTYGAFGLGPVRSTERSGTAGTTPAGVGDGDRRGRDRSPGGLAADGARRSETAVD